MDVPLIRRRRSRREAAEQRAHDLLGRAYWRATCWYGRQLRAALPPNAVRWSAIAGGAGVTAALGTALRRRRARPAHRQEPPTSARRR